MSISNDLQLIVQEMENTIKDFFLYYCKFKRKKKKKKKKKKKQFLNFKN